MAGHLHHRGVHAALGHHRQQRLQRRAPRGWSARWARRARRCGRRPCRSGPAIRPAARSPASIRWVVVVLPEVPVTPRTTHPVRRVAVDGGGQRRRAPTAGAGWTSTGTGAGSPSSRWMTATPSASVSTATAPRRDGVGGEPGAVRRGAGQRGEQVAGRGVLAAQGDPGDPDVGHGAAVGRHGADAGSQRAAGPAPESCAAAGHRSRPSPPSTPRSSCHPTEQRRSAASAWPAGSAAAPGRATAARSPAAAARRRCCGTAAPPSDRASRRRCGAGCPS